MNLVVIARTPELAEHCAAAIQALTGRHPSRTIIIGSADPDGPSWLDARVEAHCMLPREDAPETCAEMIHVTAGGEAGRHLGGDRRRRCIIHDLPVTVWWPGEPPFAVQARARPAGRRRSPRRRRLDLERRRPRPARARWPSLQAATSTRRQRLRARPPVALARGHRLDLRRPGLPALPALAAADRGDLRRPTTRPGARVRPTWSSRSTTCGWLASRLGLSVVKPLAPRSPATAASTTAARSAVRAPSR